VDLGRVRDLEERPAPGAQHPSHLAHVAERYFGIGDVLQDDVGEADIGAGIGDPAQRQAVSQHPFDVAELPVVLARELEHARRDVHRGDARYPAGDRSRHAARATTDLDYVVGLIQLGVECAQQRLEVVLARCPEPLAVGVRVVELVADEEPRVLARAPVPEPPHTRRARTRERYL
jgi:hypothetical protein